MNRRRIACAGFAAVALLLTSCSSATPGVVVKVSIDRHGSSVKVRQDADGREVVVTVGAFTRCKVGSRYPDCAEIGGAR